MTFNELAIAVPSGLLVLVIAVMILDRHLDKILKMDRTALQNIHHEPEGEAGTPVTLETLREVIREELHAALKPAKRPRKHRSLRLK